MAWLVHILRSLAAAAVLLIMHASRSSALQVHWSRWSLAQVRIQVHLAAVLKIRVHWSRWSLRLQSALQVQMVCFQSILSKVLLLH
ncbi:hypothetical protein AVEN_17401-1 [Araneus ventricosus]|uniref:Secreted protein n=1 Tax=Araneus ventricosus TaxID=182803 RepID=A0A4Y2H2P2_ARAVE|nr:hypothetical protein AVEN_17401-1 [Araneus ventricosus]